MWRWGGIFDVAKLRERLIELENVMAGLTFWADQNKARTAMDEATGLRHKLDRLEQIAIIEHRAEDLSALPDLIFNKGLH